MDLRRDFNSADLVGGRTVFNISENRYPLTARVHYKGQRVCVLTHKEYGREKLK